MASLTSSARTFSGFSDRMSLVKAVTGATANQMSSLTDRAKLLGATTSFTASDVADAMGELAKAGFNTDEILMAIAGTLNTARAGGLGLADATTITTDILRSFNLQAKDTARVGDVLAKTANVSSTDIGQIGMAMKYVASASSLAGQDLESTSAALAVLANRGMKADMAGTNLAQIFTQLANNDVQKKLIDMGVAVNDTTGNMRPLADIMAELDTATQGMGNSQKLGLFNDLFDQRGMRAAAVLAANVAEWKKSTQDMRNAKGSSAKVAAEMDDNLGGSWRSAASAAESLQIAIGGALDPQLRQLLKTSAEVARELAAFVGNNKGLVVGVGVAAGGLTVLAGAMYTVGKAMSVMSYGAGGYKAIVTWANKVADAYRAHLAAITGTATAEQQRAAASESAASAEGKLAASAGSASAALKGEAAIIQKIIAALDALAASAGLAASAQEKAGASGASYASTLGIVVGHLNTTLAVVKALTAAIILQGGALKENTGASARQAQSIKALAGWQNKLATSTAKATAALRAQIQAAREQAAASAGAAQANQAQAASTTALVRGCRQVSVAATASAVALEKASQASLLGNAAGVQAQYALIGGGMRNIETSSRVATGSLKAVDARVLETSANAKALATGADKAAAGIEQVGRKATLSQKAVAGLATALGGGAKELALMAAAYVTYKAAQKAHENSIGTSGAEESLDLANQNAEAAGSTGDAIAASVQRMRELADNSSRSAGEQLELEQILDTLNKKYNLINGSVQDVIKSQQQLNAVADAAGMAGIDEEIRKLMDERARVRGESRNEQLRFNKASEQIQNPISSAGGDGALGTTYNALHNLGSFVTASGVGELEGIQKNMDGLDKKAKELTERIGKLYELRDRKEVQKKADAAPADRYAGLDGAGYKTARERLAEIESDFRRAQQSEVENQIEDLQTQGDEVNKLLQKLKEAAAHFGDAGGAQGYEKLQEEYRQRMAGRIEAAKKAAADKAAQEKAADLASVDQMLAEDRRSTQLGEENRLIDSLSAADPQAAAKTLADYQAQLNQRVAELQTQTKAAIESAYSDGQKTPEEERNISGLQDDLSQTLSRRSEIADAVRQAQENTVDPKTWEVRGAFGNAAGALGTGASPAEDKQTKSLDSIQKDMGELVQSFKDGLTLKVS